MKIYLCPSDILYSYYYTINMLCLGRKLLKHHNIYSLNKCSNNTNLKYINRWYNNNNNEF